MSEKIILGIDIGGSGVKGALVDLEKGELKSERYRVPTPKPATPRNVAEAFAEVVDFFNYKGLVGVGFPAIVKHGVAQSAANIDSKWIGTNIEEVFGQATDCQIVAMNDADAAGVAEMRYGKGKGNNGLVMLITIGTGLGSAVFSDGQLFPNTELGHLIFPKTDIAEKFASSKAREVAKIKRKEWAKRFNLYLEHLERLFTPDLFILGGGESKKFDSFSGHFKVKTEVVPATLRNNAGIIGAAVYAAERKGQLIPK